MWTDSPKYPTLMQYAITTVKFYMISTLPVYLHILRAHISASCPSANTVPENMKPSRYTDS